MPGVAYIIITWSRESLLLTINHVDIQCQTELEDATSHICFLLILHLLSSPLPCQWLASVRCHKIFENVIVIPSSQVLYSKDLAII